MKTMGRPVPKLKLTDAERKELQRLARSRNGKAAVSRRARIILKCATGLADIDVAEELNTNRTTVGKWRRRFLADRLDGLYDEPRSGAPERSGMTWSRWSSTRR